MNIFYCQLYENSNFKIKKVFLLNFCFFANLTQNFSHIENFNMIKYKHEKQNNDYIFSKQLKLRQRNFNSLYGR